MSGEGKLILVADDEPAIVRMVQVRLEKLGYRVITADDGVVALEQIRAHKPDFVVLDIMMPRMDGFEVLQAVKNDPELEGVRVLVLTTKAEKQDYQQGFEAGADGYVVKPFDMEQILEFVSQD